MFVQYLRLPLMRELSAKLTEGETFYSQIYIFAYAAEVTVDIQIANSKDGQIHIFRFFCADLVFICLLCSVVPSTVKLDNQSCLCAIEIHNVISNGFLPLKSQWIISQKLIPQLSFLWCHVIS